MKAPIAESEPVPDNRDRYPVLHNMMSGYFYQSADLQEPDPYRIVETYRQDISQSQADCLIDEINRFLDRYGMHETTLGEAFEVIFHPETDFPLFLQEPVRDALVKVADIMAGKPVPLLPPGGNGP